MLETHSTADWKNTARLYALLAPAARSAVVLRRGPSNHVRMISWDLERDQFTPGQWLKKRVYERRCDLSRDGRYFIYFAADYKSRFGSWTAISKPPFFSALCLWPKGDGWGGGGLFCDDGRTIYLNHGLPADYEKNMATQLAQIPMRVQPLHDYSGGGEDDPIRTYRMLRDGWTLAAKGSHSKMTGPGGPYGFVQKEPTIFDKRPQNKGGLPRWSLQLRSRYGHERQGRWNVEEAGIFAARGKLVLNIGRVDWSDLDHNGDILWAWMGKLWRLEYRRNPLGFKLAQPRLLADFNDMTFENIAPPADAGNW